MFDLAAPIVPGVSAAGFRIGESISTYDFSAPMWTLREVRPLTLCGLPDFSKPVGGWFDSESVSVGFYDGLIDSIRVQRSYTGLLNGVGLGSSIRDIERSIGECGLDDEDNLVIAGVPGLIFEIEGTYQPAAGCSTADWRCDCFQRADFLSAAIRALVVSGIRD